MFNAGNTVPTVNNDSKYLWIHRQIFKKSFTEYRPSAEDNRNIPKIRSKMQSSHINNLKIKIFLKLKIIPLT